MIKAKSKSKPKPKKANKPVGPTLTRIAEELGVSISTVWRWKTEGIPGKNGGDNFRARQLKAALQKLEAA